MICLEFFLQNFNQFAGAVYDRVLQNDVSNGCVRDPDSMDHAM